MNALCSGGNRTRWVAALLLVLGLLVLCAGALTGCAPRTGARVLQVALSGSPNTLDPHRTSATLTFQVLRSVYDTLVESDSEGRIVPALLERWEVSENGLVWRFYLRSGVRFHNGQPLTARDVEASVVRLQGEDSPRAGEFAAIQVINVIDEQTLELVLSAPYAPLLSSLASGWAAIVPRALIEEGHDFSLHPVGSGPFRFDEWVQDGKIVLSKNADYWKEGAPALEGVVFNILTENAIRVQALLNGDIDVLDVIEPTDLPIFEESPEIRVTRALSSLAMVIPLNTSHPLLGDILVRQAIGHAIDRERVLNEAYGGGVPIDTFMDFNDPYYPALDPLYRYDPDRAREIIRDNNLAVDTEIVMAVPQNFEPHVRAAEIYQQMLREVGFNVTLRLIDWPTWISEVYTNANYDLTVIGHTGRLDPDARFQEYGYTRWNNDHVSELVNRARSVVPFSERKALYDRALGIMAEEVPFIFIGTNYRYVVSRANVQGLILDTKLDTFDLRTTTKVPL